MIDSRRAAACLHGATPSLPSPACGRGSGWGRRKQVIAAAESWLGTPYHHMGRLKGVGCDCLTLLAAVYHEAGIVPAIEIPFYPPDWHLHRSIERYVEGLREYAREVDPIEIPGSPGSSPGPGPGTEPGNIALFRFGRCFAHGAVVVEWPHLIHAWNGLGVVRGDASKPNLLGRDARFFSPFGEASPDPPDQVRGRGRP